MPGWAVFLIAIAIFLVWSLCLLLPWIAPQMMTGYSTEVAGQIGDTFGALNALFAAGAFIGVLWTLNLQRRQFRLQQDEMEAARKDRQIERFDGAFIQLLTLLRELRDEVRYRSSVPGSQAAIGGTALTLAAEEFLRYLQTAIEAEAPLAKTMVAGIYQDGVHRPAEEGLGPYFRIICTILRRVSEADFRSTADKVQYGNILRSQLGSSDATLIAGNGLISASNDFFDYIVEYRLLKYLPNGPFRQKLEASGIYPPQTFQSRD